MIRIAPSILASDFSRLGDEIRKVDHAGADLIHIDIMDGVFVPNITIGPCVVKCLRPCTKLPFDVHLMIVHPERYLQDFAQAGADYLTVHLEAEEDIRPTLRAIRKLGVKAGISIKPATPAEKVFPLLPFVDLVLVMTVEPGFGNQKLIDECLPKVEKIRQEANRIGKTVEISVDGGVNASTIQRVHQAGVDFAVAGSAVFREENTAAVLRQLKEGIC